MSLLHFHIDYQTRWGENVCLAYRTDTGHDQLLKLHTHDGRHWQAELSLPASVRWIDYAYRIDDEARGVLRSENCPHRRLMIRRRKSLFLSDTWTEQGIPSEFLSKAFTQTLFGQAMPQRRRTRQQGRCLLVLRALPAPQGYRWALLGSSERMGQWVPERAHKLQPSDTYEYVWPLSPDDFQERAYYKYVLQSETNPSDVVWEEGENRRLPYVSADADTAVVHNDSSPRLGLPLWRGAGVVIPVFSLRSERSQGIGDFSDLMAFVGWAAHCGMRAVQILPVNDTTATRTWRDSYPYNPISVYALHPVYLDLGEWSGSRAFARVKDEAAELNTAASVRFEEVLRLKLQFLSELFVEKGPAIMRQADFSEFCRDNSGWLPDYARFCFLRDAFSTADFRAWREPDQYLSVHRKEAERAARFWSWVQYLLHCQLSRAHEFARSRGVILKGDIPIGVSPNSADAWVNPQLYHFDGQAGAPPDYFAREGQNWGFPTYDWEAMAADNYAWWRQRLAVMQRYFDAYRLDHVLGFFRIWEIPSNQLWGTLGRFRPALPLSSGEIAAHGFTLPPMLYTRPHFSERQLARLAERADSSALAAYFQKEGGYYTLRPEVACQRDVVRRVPEGKVRAVLLEAVADVLFIADSQNEALFHPAINAQATQAYAALPADQQRAFDALHHDFFHLRHNDFWGQMGQRKLDAVTRYMPSDWMLPCAEDLGFVPSCVKPVLDRLHILTLEIQSMPKQTGVRFAVPETYPYRSVATIATHDMAPFRLWWHADAEGRAAFWHDYMGETGEPPAEATAAICRAVVAHHLQSGSMLCLLAWQDWMALDASLRRDDMAAEQINNPANPNQHWVYRMHLTIEQLYKAVDFNERLRVMIAQSGR